MKQIISILITCCWAFGTAAFDYKPTSCQNFDYNEGEWVLFASYTLGYDKQGNIILEDADYRNNVSKERTTTEYNSDNLPIRETSYVFNDGSWEQRRSNSYKYDSVVKDWILELDNHDDYFDFGFRWRIEVVRNETGNVVSARYYWWDSDSNVEALQYEMNTEYSSNGQAEKIIESFYIESASKKQRVWSNLEWSNTDGQIATHVLGAKGNEYNWFLKGANRLKSADVSENGVHKWALSAEYSGKRDYLARFTAGNELIRSEQMEYADEYGGYTQTVFDDGEWTAKTVEYDEQGNQTVSAEAKGTDIENLDPVFAYFYENDYDPTTGCLVQIIVSQSEDGGIPGLSEKIVYSDFVDVSTNSVQEIELDVESTLHINGLSISTTGSGLIKVYDMDGKVVASSTNGNVVVPCYGLYIVAVDGKAIKVKI